jgi:FMN phosphatase YigB (HAD superfamily)
VQVPGRQIRAVVFDIGDTLVDASGIEEAGWDYATARLARLNLCQPENDLGHHYREAVAGWADSPSLNRLFGLPHEMFAAAAKAARLSPTAGLVGYAEYQAFVRRSIKRNRRLVRLFRSLHRRGLRIGIVSDGTTPEQLETLHRLGVLPFVDAAAISDEVGVLKPDPKIFSAALEELGVEPGEALYVGDNWDRDVVGAREAGLRPMYVARPGSGAGKGEEPTVEFGRLGRILDHLDRSALPTRTAERDKTGTGPSAGPRASSNDEGDCEWVELYYKTLHDFRTSENRAFESRTQLFLATNAILAAGLAFSDRLPKELPAEVWMKALSIFGLAISLLGISVGLRIRASLNILQRKLTDLEQRIWTVGPGPYSYWEARRKRPWISTRVLVAVIPMALFFGAWALLLWRLIVIG